MKAVIKKNDYTELVKTFIESLDISKKSIRLYKTSIHKFFSWIENNNIVNPTYIDIVKYKKYLIELELSPATISLYLCALRRFFSFMESTGLYKNITSNIRGMKSSRNHKRDSLTVEQYKNIIKNIDIETEKGARDYAIITLAINTGLRTIEISNSTIGGIRNHSGKLVLWIQGKGRDSNDDFVLLTDNVQLAIQNYLSLRNDNLHNDSFLFTAIENRNHCQAITTRTIRRIIKKHMKIAGIISDRITAHSLRHSAVTFALIGGATIQEVQAMARHRNITTTMIYAHNLDRLEYAAESKIAEVLA